MVNISPNVKVWSFRFVSSYHCLKKHTIVSHISVLKIYQSSNFLLEFQWIGLACKLKYKVDALDFPDSQVWLLLLLSVCYCSGVFSRKEQSCERSLSCLYAQ